MLILKNRLSVKNDDYLSKMTRLLLASRKISADDLSAYNLGRTDVSNDVNKQFSSLHKKFGRKNQTNLWFDSFLWILWLKIWLSEVHVEVDHEKRVSDQLFRVELLPFWYFDLCSAYTKWYHNTKKLSLATKSYLVDDPLQITRSIWKLTIRLFNKLTVLYVKMTENRWRGVLFRLW